MALTRTSEDISGKNGHVEKKIQLQEHRVCIGINLGGPKFALKGMLPDLLPKKALQLPKLKI